MTLHQTRFEPLPGKGDTRCNRMACQAILTQNTRWWNGSTRAFYCPSCAHRINEYNPQLCTPPTHTGSISGDLSMTSEITVYACTQCGATTPRSSGLCTSCSNPVGFTPTTPPEPNDHNTAAMMAFLAPHILPHMPIYKRRDPPTANADAVRAELRARRKQNFQKLHGDKS